MHEHLHVSSIQVELEQRQCLTSGLDPVGEFVPGLAELRSTNGPIELASEGPYWPTSTTHFSFALQLPEPFGVCTNIIFHDAASFGIEQQPPAATTSMLILRSKEAAVR